MTPAHEFLCHQTFTVLYRIVCPSVSCYHRCCYGRLRLKLLRCMRPHQKAGCYLIRRLFLAQEWVAGILAMGPARRLLAGMFPPSGRNHKGLLRSPQSEGEIPQ